MYDSFNKRFNTVDPLHQFASPYCYVGNNPVSFIDPTGMFTYIIVFTWTDEDGITHTEEIELSWTLDDSGNFIITDVGSNFAEVCSTISSYGTTTTGLTGGVLSIISSLLKASATATAAENTFNHPSQTANFDENPDTVGVIYDINHYQDLLDFWGGK